MITRLIGDKHGLWNDYQTVIHGCERTVQLGDFGIGFGQGDHWHDRVNDIVDGKQHRFIRGNHDNPGKCKDMLGWIPDGTVENDVMYIGGAWSIDQDYRTPGHDWWAAEELSANELTTLYSVYTTVKPRVMLTHDCPTLAAYHMFIRAGLRTYGNNTLTLTRTGEMFQKMFEAHQPEQWYFGHWHHTKRMQIDRTVFQCLGELDYMDVDL